MLTPEEHPTGSHISADEEIVFYPTCATYDGRHSTWTLPIHGIIYEPEDASRRNNAVVASIRKTLQLDKNETPSKLLDRRIRLFLVDNERGQRIYVRIGGRVFPAGTSEADGHFRNTLVLAAADIEPSLERNVDGDWLPFEAVTRRSDERRFEGRVQLVPPAGLSVISDIDDTIKHSVVTDRKALLANTFLHPFRSAPGMPELYRRGAQLGLVFHYVSGSPWQLYLPLAEFLEAENFPHGSFHLKQFRLKDRSMVNLLRSQESYKLPVIESILAAYPERRFVLVGDSGEEDPEIYAKVAKKHGGRIVAIFIRNVSAETRDNPRFAALGRQLGDVRFELFDQPGSLAAILAEVAGQE